MGLSELGAQSADGFVLSSGLLLSCRPWYFSATFRLFGELPPRVASPGDGHRAPGPAERASEPRGVAAGRRLAGLSNQPCRPAGAPGGVSRECDDPATAACGRLSQGQLRSRCPDWMDVPRRDEVVGGLHTAAARRIGPWLSTSAVWPGLVSQAASCGGETRKQHP